MFSTGFKSGDFDGNGRSVMLWDGKLLRDMPPGLIEDEDGVRARRDRQRNFLEMEGHGLAVAKGQNEPGAFSFGRADSAENISRRRPLVAWRRGPDSALRPSPGDLVFLSDPSFVFT